MNSARAKFKNMYQTSPIVLTGGIAANQPAGHMSVSSLYDPPEFANFRLATGSSLLKNECATYPFANSTVAGNALIAEPLTLSMVMVCPANPNIVGYSSKNSVISSMIASLKQHNATGGLYTVYTPALCYEDGILRDLRDVTPEDMKQRQVIYQWDFYFPLLTVDAAQAAHSSLIQKLNSGVPTVGKPSWSSGATSPSALGQAGNLLTPPSIQ